MELLVRELAANLDTTAKLYEEIVAAERRKGRALAQRRIGDLPDIVAIEERLLTVAADLEARRLALRDGFAAAEARLGPAPRLGEVITLLDGAARTALAEKHHRLRALARELDAVNRANADLLRACPDLLVPPPDAHGTTPLAPAPGQERA